MKGWLAVFATVAVLGGVAGCGGPAGARNTGVKDQPAAIALPVPPLDTGTAGKHGDRRFNLDIESGRTDFGAGRTGDTLGYNGSYLGPTLRMSDGEHAEMRITNSTSEMTTVHWHGLHVPARSDGGPHSMIEPGGTWRPTWRVDQPAATLWYHSHPHGQTAQQVYRGLAGMLIVDDQAAKGKGLPSEYGVDDIPLIVQDKNFDGSGNLVVQDDKKVSTGIIGDTIVTNGKIGTYLPVTTQAVRLRVLNASNARFYDFGLSDGRAFDVVASDGGLLEHPVSTTSVQLAPAERAEIVLRMQPSETVQLISSPPDLSTGQDQLYGTGTFNVVELRAADQLRASPQLSPDLGGPGPADQTTATTTRKFLIQGTAINGRPMDLNRIDFAVPVDNSEIWEITNEDRQPHSFHVHNTQFRILDIDGAPPRPEMAGWKDTVYVPPLQHARILVKFTDYTDPNWPYMFHCHLLLHEDNGVMGQFVVVKPGQKAGMIPMPQHSM